MRFSSRTRAEQDEANPVPGHSLVRIGLSFYVRSHVVPPSTGYALENPYHSLQGFLMCIYMFSGKISGT